MLSGPGFEPKTTEAFKSISGKDGAHYNIYSIKTGIDALRGMFPDGEADEMNLVLFSTSGVHGSYTTLEEIEAGLLKYGEEPEFGDDGWPDDYAGDELTVLILHPRLVCLRYGNIQVKLADIPYLKKLRATSQAAFAKIGMPE